MQKYAEHAQFVEYANFANQTFQTKPTTPNLPNQDCDIEKCVQAYLCLPKLPEDLLCLNDCFTNVVYEIEQNDEDSLKCSDNELIQAGRGTSFVENIDCLVHFARSKPFQRIEGDPNINRNNIRSDRFIEAHKTRGGTKKQKNEPNKRQERCWRRIS